MSSALRSAELEQALRRALADPGAVLDFYRALLEATMLVMGETHGEEGFAMTSFEVDGKSVVLAFTSQERIDKYDSSAVGFPVGGALLLEQLPSDAVVLINPASEASYAIDRRLVPALVDESVFRVDEESFNGEFYSGPLPDPKAALKLALREIFARHDEVRAAFMTLIYAPHSGLPPYPAIGIDVTSEFEAIAEECLAALDAMEHAALYQLGDDSLSAYAVANSLPFYFSEMLTGPRPAPMTRDELLTFLESYPAEPPLMSSLMHRYLAQSAEAEAREEWEAFALKERLRFWTFASYAAERRRIKELEIERYQVASTHREARELLLQVLRDRSEYCLFLRNFAGEAAQKLETRPGTGRPGIQTVRWMTLYGRTGDRAIDKLLERSPYPAVGLANPRDAMPRISPIPQLQMRDEEWLHVLITLVARAKLIFVNVHDLSPGISEELLAIQRQNREDETLIIVPDDKHEEKASDFTEMLRRDLGFDFGQRQGPELGVLSKMMATFGRVLTLSDLEQITEAST